MFILALFLTLYPLLGESCSCAGFSNRRQTLVDGICRGNVFSGIVVGATCSCGHVSYGSGYPSNLLECRSFSYSATDDSYTVQIINREQYDDDYGYDYLPTFIRTCEEAENVLVPGGNLVRLPEQNNITVENSSQPFVCPFNDYDYDPYAYPPGPDLCRYEVRITEVFIGNYTDGEVVTSAGPDVLTSCASIYGRLLQLNTEYLVGVGGACSAFYEWAELSVYTESDLQLLRKVQEQVDYGLIECGSLALHASVTLVVLTATGLSYLM